MVAILKRIGQAILLFFGLVLLAGLTVSVLEETGLLGGETTRIFRWVWMLLALGFTVLMLASQRTRRAMPGATLIVWGVFMALAMLSNAIMYLVTGQPMFSGLEDYTLVSQLFCFGVVFFLGLGLLAGGADMVKRSREA